MRSRLPAILALTLFLAAGCGEKIGESPAIDRGMQESAERLVGLEFTDAERDLEREDLEEQRLTFANLRARTLDNAVRPAVRFDPLLPWGGKVPEAWTSTFLRDFPPSFDDPGPVARPADLEELAYADVTHLAALVRSRRVTCLELTELFLARLAEHGPQLECVVTLLPERARARARELDRMLDRGDYLGPLHGIPYGAKDLLSVPDAPTTWGATCWRG